MPNTDHKRLSKLRKRATPVARLEARARGARRRALERRGDDRRYNNVIEELERILRELRDLRELWDVVTRCVVSEEGLQPFVAERAETDAVDVAALRVRAMRA